MELIEITEVNNALAQTVALFWICPGNRISKNRTINKEQTISVQG